MASFLANLFGGGSSGSSGSSPSRGAVPPPNLALSTPAPSYSFAQLQQLYNKLSKFRESDLEKGHGDAVVETVRQITEALIWGEQNDTNFFDFFCEKSILADFIRVLSLTKSPKKVRVQLLQTLSILVQNIRRQTSLYYLLSGNHVNKLIEIPLDFDDDEILAYYITLLKSFAMRLDHETIKFFFIQHPSCTFPLYIESTKFFQNRDQMVRAAVRTITLQVYRIEDQAMRKFVLRHAKEDYFSQLAAYLRVLWIQLDQAVRGAGRDDPAAMHHRNELQQDLIVYLSDVFELGVKELNEVLADRLLNCVLLPVLVAGIARVGDGGIAVLQTEGASEGMAAARGDAAGEAQGHTLSPAVSLFLLRQVFDTFRTPVLLEPLATALLMPRVPIGFAFTAVLPHIGGNTAKSDDVVNVLREHFLSCFRHFEDGLFLLAAAVVHSCVCNRRAFSSAFLTEAGILPPSEEAAGGCSPFSASAPVPSERTLTSSSAAAAGGSASWRGAGGLGEASPPAARDESGEPEVFFYLLQGLHRHAAWQLDNLQVLIHILMDVFLDPLVVHNAMAHMSVMRALDAALRSSAQLLRHVWQDCQPGSDTLLDLFFEEWELHKAPPVDVSEVCSNPRLLLASMPTSALGVTSVRRPSAGGSAERAAHKAVRSFLLIRRLTMDAVRYAPQVRRARPPEEGGRASPWAAAPSCEASPLEVDEEASSGLREGTSFEIGTFQRIVCSIAGPQGKTTRYLLLHDYWLLLVQPDLAAPGFGVVSTLWPVRQVHSHVDRSDPRTLQLGMNALASASHSRPDQPGGGVPGASPERPKEGFLTISLSFEDVKKCHGANVHLQKRRMEVRAQLAQRAAAFLDKYCAEPAPCGRSSPAR